MENKKKMASLLSGDVASIAQRGPGNTLENSGGVNSPIMILINERPVWKCSWNKYFQLPFLSGHCKQ